MDRKKLFPNINRIEKLVLRQKTFFYFKHHMKKKSFSEQHKTNIEKIQFECKLQTYKYI